MNEAVTTLRRFNRSYTQRIGVLDESFLGSGRPLGPARLLFEIGPDGAAVRDLRQRIGLDSGYLSRLLRQLEADGSVTVESDPDDRRRRVARLTEQGTSEWVELDRRSESLASDILDPLGGRLLEQLTHALTTADRIIRAATIDFETVDPLSSVAREALRSYFAELDRRFPDGFDPGDALTAGLDEFEPPDGAFLLAVSDGEIGACGGVQRIDARTAEIKRMWVHPDWRGLGLGRRTLEALERLSTSAGYDTVVLDTNATLTQAIAMYESAGYTATERYNDNPYAQRWFTKTLSSG